MNQTPIMSDVEKRARDAHDAGRFSEAAELFRRAAECHASASAAIDLGSLYARGAGVPRSYADASKWFHKAAELGEGRGAALVAMYDCVTPDNERFQITNGGEYVGWLVKAFDLGYVHAAYAIGMMRSGELRPRGSSDSREARKWFLLGKSKGDVPCQVTFDEGKGHCDFAI